MMEMKQRALEEVMEILKITKDLYEIIPAELPEMTPSEAVEYISDITDLQLRLSSLVIIYKIDENVPKELDNHLEYLSDLIVEKFRSRS